MSRLKYGIGMAGIAAALGVWASSMMGVGIWPVIVVTIVGFFVGFFFKRPTPKSVPYTPPPTSSLLEEARLAAKVREEEWARRREEKIKVDIEKCKEALLSEGWYITSFQEVAYHYKALGFDVDGLWIKVK